MPKRSMWWFGATRSAPWRRVSGGRVDQRRALGLSCGLVYLADTTGRKIDPAFATDGQRVNFADGFPVLLGSLASLADLNTRLAVPIPIGRFRPNIVVSGATSWAEDCWRQIRIRNVLFSVVKGIVTSPLGLPFRDFNRNH
jgi:uncharacterized protein YcbX